MDNKRQAELTKRMQSFSNTLDTKYQKRINSSKTNKSAWRHFSPWNQNNMREFLKYNTRKKEKYIHNTHRLPFSKQNSFSAKSKDVLPGKENYKFQHHSNISDHLKEYNKNNSCTSLTNQHRQNIEKLNCLDLKGPEMPYHDLLEAVKPVPFPFKLDGISKIDKLIIQNLARGQLLPKTPFNEKEKFCSKFDDKNKILSESIKDKSTSSFTSSTYEIEKTNNYNSHNLMTFDKSQKLQGVESFKLPTKLTIPKTLRKKSASCVENTYFSTYTKRSITPLGLLVRAKKI